MSGAMAALAGAMLPLVGTCNVSTRTVTGSTSTLTTGAAVVTASGGTGAYTYSWAMTGTGGIVADDPTLASTTFTKNGALGATAYNNTATCTVSDGINSVDASPTVAVTCTRT